MDLMPDGVAAVLLVVGALACAWFTWRDPIVSSRERRRGIALSWFPLLFLFLARGAVFGWNAAPFFYAGAMVYWAVLLGTGFRPLLLARRLWDGPDADDARLQRRFWIGQAVLWTAIACGCAVAIMGSALPT